MGLKLKVERLLDLLQQKSRWLVWMVGIIWFGVAVLLVERTGCVIVDGFQSLGAVSTSSHPGELHWPMVGSFMSYDKVWGFHWIGWPMLRSLLLPILPWGSLGELILLCGIWLITSFFLMELVRRASDRASAAWVGIISLMAPGFLVAVQSYRPEIPTALFLLLGLHYWQADTVRTKLIRFLSLFVCPLLHPLGFVVPGSWLLLAFFLEGREHGWRNVIPKILPLALPMVLGASCMALWLWCQPEALIQFRNNILSQRLLIQGLGPGHLQLMRWSFASLGVLPLVILLLGALSGSAVVFVTAWRKRPTTRIETAKLYAALGLVMAVVFHIVAKNPNPNHFVAVAPLAAWMYVIAVQTLFSSWPKMFRALACMAIVTLSGALMAKNVALLVKNRGASYRGSLVRALDDIPATGNVFIPVVFWEAALQHPSRHSRQFFFSTFPNIIERNDRAVYEQQALDRMQSGDLLIWDVWQEEAGVFNFVEATALRHVLIRPEVSDSDWEKISTINAGPAYSRNQPIQFVVYRKR
jgi:hypothetical protein